MTQFISRYLLARHSAFALLVLTLSFSTQAYEPRVGKVTASIGPTLFITDQPTNSDSFYPNSRPSLALITEAVFAKNSGLEIGIFYLDKPYYRSSGSDFIIQKRKRMYITTGYRYWWCKHFSSALGIFSSFSMGNIKTIEATAGIDEDFKTSAQDITKYGIDGSMRFEFDVNKRDGIAFDMRYSYSYTSYSNERANHIMAGLFYTRDIEIK